uniref:sugar O-acetyltransferase n=1 Tax=Thaumasiovibrio occultus TaxID=1891184 RepID=UPI000B3554E5|nr:sugar O-acetyltransferase [Thaumasiovibrio occultus]
MEIKTKFDVCEPLTRDIIDEQLELRCKLHEFNHARPDDEATQQRLLSEMLGTYQGAIVIAPFHCDIGRNIHFGEGGFINSDCVILDMAPVRLGDYVMLGPKVQLLATTHPVDLAERVLPYICGNEIVIGDNVWIGGGSIVLPGVTIGDRSVIGAGSVVTKDIPSDVVAAGNPCRVIKPIEHGELPDYEELAQIYAAIGL